MNEERFQQKTDTRLATLRGEAKDAVRKHCAEHNLRSTDLSVGKICEIAIETTLAALKQSNDESVCRAQDLARILRVRLQDTDALASDAQRHLAPLVAAIEETIALLERGGFSHAEALRQAFLAGGKFWEFKKTGATMWQSDQRDVYVEAERRYPDGITATPARGLELAHELRMRLSDTHYKSPLKDVMDHEIAADLEKIIAQYDGNVPQESALLAAISMVIGSPRDAGEHSDDRDQRILQTIEGLIDGTVSPDLEIFRQQQMRQRNQHHLSQSENQ